MPRSLKQIADEMEKLTIPSGDTEVDHSDADRLLLEAIERLAIGRAQSVWDEAKLIRERFDRVKRWYA